MKRAPALLLPPLLLAALGCETVMPNRGAASRRDDELTRLERRVLELEREARMSEVELGRLRRQVAELSARLEREAPRPAAAPARPLPPEPRPQPPAAVEPLESEDLGAPALRPAAPPAATPVGVDGQELYDRGYTLYHQGSYVDAESAFRGFLQDFGSSDLADNAQFWIGEARLRRGDLSGALAAFRETASRFPRGNKVPDALFRTGDCLEQLGDLDGARDAWRETIERFPNSAAAALSEERLDAIP